MSNYYKYRLYEDDFAIYLCILVGDKCVCIQQIKFDIGYNENGTIGSLCLELAENPEAWREWKQAELNPDIMYEREIDRADRLIGEAIYVTSWAYYDMSVEASDLIFVEDCAECKMQDGDDDV